MVAGFRLDTAHWAGSRCCCRPPTSCTGVLLTQRSGRAVLELPARRGALGVGAFRAAARTARSRELCALVTARMSAGRAAGTGAVWADDTDGLDAAGIAGRLRHHERLAHVRGLGLVALAGGSRNGRAVMARAVAVLPLHRVARADCRSSGRAARSASDPGRRSRRSWAAPGWPAAGAAPPRSEPTSRADWRRRGSSPSPGRRCARRRQTAAAT